ncbi:MAG TPA: hypothetical protein VJ904_01390, partial [Tichowtungia sp.]|nr:hypothetical protein [Tichowtungia sp.]
NVLVLDEPTNDLDADTMDVLEEQLIEFDGTILLVSHDREFLNNTVDRILSFEGDGRVGEYAGGYDDWVAQSGGLNKKPEARSEKSDAEKVRTRKLTNKERTELKELPKKIEALEEEQEKLTAILNDPDFYRSDPEEIKQVTDRAEAVPHKLEAAYERWADLEAHA